MSYLAFLVAFPSVLCSLLLALVFKLWTKNIELKRQLPKRVNGRFVKRK